MAISPISASLKLDILEKLPFTYKIAVYLTPKGCRFTAPTTDFTFKLVVDADLDENRNDNQARRGRQRRRRLMHGKNNGFVNALGDRMKGWAIPGGMSINVPADIITTCTDKWCRKGRRLDDSNRDDYEDDEETTTLVYDSDTTSLVPFPIDKEADGAYYECCHELKQEYVVQPITQSAPVIYTTIQSAVIETLSPNATLAPTMSAAPSEASSKSPSKAPSTTPSEAPSGQPVPLPNIPDTTAIQLGQDLFGEAEDDFFGLLVALSTDGLTMATSAVSSDGNGDNIGAIRVFSFDVNMDMWVQLGQTLYRFDAMIAPWSPIDLSADGRILAIGTPLHIGGTGFGTGHVRVFTYNQATGQWDQMGQTIDAEADGDRFGGAVALSADGQTLAAGAIMNRPNGHVRVFTYKQGTGEWVQLGQDIDGDALASGFGFYVALSADGFTVAVGAVDGFQGNARVFAYNQTTDEWDQLGQSLVGKSVSDRFGWPVALSADGRTVSAGVPETGGNRGGYILTSAYNEGTGQWTQLGQALVGANFSSTGGNGEFGYTFSLSDDGLTVAASGYHNVSQGLSYVLIFSYNRDTDQWTQTHSIWDAPASILSTALSGDGYIVAVGDPFEGDGSGPGHVRVYDMTPSVSPSASPSDSPSFTP